MKAKGFLAIGIALLIIFSFSFAAQAYVKKVYLNVWTTNYTNDQQLNVWLEIYDTVISNPPDAVKSIKVTAPDGTEFDLTTAMNWLQYDRGYWAQYRAEDFDSGVIPAGKYKVRVEAKEYNLVIEETDTIDATFLDPPVITSPSDGSTIGASHMFTWTAVPGAKYYRILLWHESWNEPVYWFWRKRFYTDHTACILPRGDLRPDSYYRFRVEARSGSQDLDKRSRSDWIYFYTEHWE